jgi:hypothetical protein
MKRTTTPMCCPTVPTATTAGPAFSPPDKGSGSGYGAMTIDEGARDITADSGGDVSSLS